MRSPLFRPASLLEGLVLLQMLAPQRPLSQILRGMLKGPEAARAPKAPSIKRAVLLRGKHTAVPTPVLQLKF